MGSGDKDEWEKCQPMNVVPAQSHEVIKVVNAIKKGAASGMDQFMEGSSVDGTPTFPHS